MNTTTKATTKPGAARVVKSVEWSYPTSTNAERFGFARVGCWTVEITTITGGEATTEAASGHASEAAAVVAAGARGEPWASWATFARERSHARKFEPLPLRVRAQVAGEKPWFGTWAEFAAINEAMGPEDLADVLATVRARKVYRGGGGAAAEFKVRLADADEPRSYGRTTVEPGAFEGVEPGAPSAAQDR